MIDKSKLAVFWVDTGEDAELCYLMPGDRKSFSTFSEDEEGFSSSHTTYTCEIRQGIVTVVRERYMKGRDCDGLVESGSKLVCPIDRLEAGYVDDEGKCWPVWEDDPEETDRWGRPCSSWQRDHSAEKCGY